MELLQLTISDAKLIYPSAPEDIKRKLESCFGKSAFKPIHYKDIKSFEDAAEAEGLTPEEIARYKTHKNKEEEIEHHYGMLRIIAKALRGDWTPDYGNSSQQKWRPWFRWDKSGAGFVFASSSAYCDTSHSGSGSRLCFPEEKISDYFAKQFIALHKVVLEN